MDLENCTRPIIRARADMRALGNLISSHPLRRVVRYHRQDVKGLRWMPWHQESMKDVDGCDKPRLGAEQPLTRGSPNG